MKRSPCTSKRHFDWLMTCVLIVGSTMPWSQAKAAPAGKPIVLGSAPKVISKEKYDYNNDGEILNHTLTKQSVNLGNYTLYEEIVDEIGLIHFKVSLGGKVFLDKALPRWKGLNEASYSLIDPLKNDRCTMSPVAVDINGDGTPELFVAEDSGAARGPTEYRIYSLTSAGPKEIFHGSLLNPCFKDADSDGIFEIIVDDDIFEGWQDCSTAQSYFPQVMLQWNGSLYAPKALRKSPMSFDRKKEVARLESQIKSAGKPKPGSKAISSEVFASLIKLTYAGQKDEAKALLQALYPNSTKLWISTKPDQSPVTRDAFWKSFESQLSKGRYASAISRTLPIKKEQKSSKPFS